jgi:hypothetical protein
MKAIFTSADDRQDIAENLMMAVARSDDADGPHILIADINTGEKTQLIFSKMEILQLYIWSHDVLKRSG